MKQNFLADPYKSYHEQHALPISPQNFDPLNKSREQYPQKKPIFSNTTSTKPKTLFEAISEVENPPVKGDDSLAENDLKKMLAKEMSSQLEGIKNEILEGFTALLKGSLNPSKIANKDVQDMKRQMVYNKNKFEEIQDQIGHLNQQYNDINSHYTQELQSLKMSNSFSTQPRDDFSGFEEGFQNQVESQLQSFKDELLSEVHSTLNSKGRARRNDDVVDELNQIKYSFEGQLKQNFELINGRVKKAEENLNEIMKRKRDLMDGIRGESLTSIDGQNRMISNGINQASNTARTKYEQSQTKAVVNAEINRRADSYRAEVDSLRKAIMLNHGDVEEMNTSVNRRLEGLDSNIKRQFFDVQNSNRKSETLLQRQDLVEKRIQKLNGDSEGYHRTIQQLRGQLEEVTRAHRQLQSQASTPSSQDIISRLEAKIGGLQNHIREIESQLRRQQQQMQQHPQSLMMTSPPKTTRERMSETARLDQSVTSDDNSFMWASPRSHRAEYRSPFENEMTMPRERRSNGGYQTNEEKLRLPDFNNDSVKYNGDPKVKSIIDEVNQKKKQTQSPFDRKKNMTERPLQLETVADLTSYKDLRKSHYLPSTATARSHRDLPEVNTSPVRNQKSSKYFEAGGDVNHSQMRTKTEGDSVIRPQIMIKKAPVEVNNSKKIKHAKILSQINYFIYGTVSNMFEEEEDSEIYCNLDDDGYVFDEDGDFVLDSRGNRVKLSPEQIEKFNNNNMIE